MSSFAPATHLETHEVTNQPADFAGRNLFLSDRALREAVAREAGDWLSERCAVLGAVVGSEDVLALGEAANRHPPELATFDRYGRRLDEVRFHPAYHQLMALAMRHRIHDVAWSETRPGRHLAHAVLLALFTQAEAGTMCPINMTYASVAALSHGGEMADAVRARLIGGQYDAPLRPIADKAGVTVGMAMTEKQGGSDVRANTTRAIASNEGVGAYRLTGHKWFCSAPMSDAFLTLAQTGNGLSCFLLPRITPDGARNGFHLMRLKDKLGNRSNASAEVEYHDAYAVLIGEEGRGIATIIDMVHHTRLGTMAATLGLMRMGLAQALHHIGHRRAFGRLLGEQPAMRAVIADLALEYEAAVLLTARVAMAFDAEDAEGRAFARLAVALGKFWLTKRNPNFLYECMECLGGAGYIEENLLPRLFRESPLNAIWEGSGNVIALDILRTLGREPAALAAYRAELAAAKGGNPQLDAAVAGLDSLLARADEAGARFVAERLALLLQGALLLRHAPAAVADAFCATRLADEGGRVFGTLPKAVDVAAILARQHG
jgi:putative acyl-CoA dehydrogenase